MAEAFGITIQAPGIQFPESEFGAWPWLITEDFLATLSANGFPEDVPFTIDHGPRDELHTIGVVASQGMQSGMLRGVVRIDRDALRGQEVALKAEAAIAAGDPIDVSFELDEVAFEEPPEVAMAAGRPLVPVGGRVGAVTALQNGLEGACGDACTVTTVLAQEACCSDCGHRDELMALFKDVDDPRRVVIPESLRRPAKAFHAERRVGFEATMSPNAPTNKQEALTEDWQAKFEAAQEEVEALRSKEAKNRERVEALEAEIESLRDMVKAANDGDDVSDDRLAAMEETLESLKSELADARSVAETYRVAEHEALIEEVEALAEEAGAEDFEVDEEAEIPVLLAQRAAFMAAVKRRDPEGTDGDAVRRRAAFGRRGTTLKEGEVASAATDTTKALFAAALQRRRERRKGHMASIPPQIARGMTAHFSESDA